MHKSDIKKKKEKKKRLRNLYFERSTVKIYQIYERSSWSSSTDANDRSSREKSPKWRTSKHDYTTTNVKKTSDSSFKACIYFHGITIQCRERKKKSVQSNVSPRKLAFPIHFASCWINDDWVHDSDFHYSQSTLTLETFECVSSFYEGDETSSQTWSLQISSSARQCLFYRRVLKKYPICNLSKRGW